MEVVEWEVFELKILSVRSDVCKKENFRMEYFRMKSFEGRILGNGFRTKSFERRV